MRIACSRKAGFVMLAVMLTTLFVAGCKVTPPNVTRTTPSNQATNVPVSPAVVTVTFDKPMVTGSARDTVTITPVVGTQKPDYAWSTGDQVLVITYPQNFQPNTTYTVKIGESVKAANNVTLANPVEFTFTTGSAAAAIGTVPTQPAQPAPTPPAQPTQPAQPAQPTQPAQPAQPTQPAQQPAQPAQPTLTFAKDIKPLAETRCDGCHGSMATGKMSVYSNASKYVTANNPDNSPYYTRPIGQNHPNAWGDRATVVKNWINQGVKE